ncbi:excinuclease ABC subunit UvrC [Odoribacter sp. OttesenSCG-928-L07]|nr:excinuclease ABC subunit UvrC [Odoribacter sp. OttesenSCG-928-L07]MDL2238668.1 excinuclease ABC subunit UvrC [Bacteroidales bacterium OttesenSCG-928-L14]MDL2240303.1 excinuclease ABC subunit UvrC [Bacteroidales bacterium OttesenSCG-928-K22]
MLLKDDTKQLRTILKSLPDSPGVYLYSDENGEVIYVGKAKSLKKRVAQYFNKDISGKTKVLVSKIVSVRTIVVNNEADALLLENNLIKQYLPRYNVMLKDDKTYPWICIKNELFPRVVKTRKKINDGSEYFGPYPSVRMLNTLMDTIEKLYKLRSCNLKLTRENIKKGKYSVCLKNHIGKCAGPCAGLQSEEDYNQSLKNVRKIINGDISSIMKELEHSMYEHADKLEFEQAQVYKEKIDILRNYQSKSMVAANKDLNVDVFTVTSDKSTVYINYMRVVEGALIYANTFEVKKVLDESEDEVLTLMIPQIREQSDSNSKEIIMQFQPSIQLDGIKYTVPKGGDKKNLLDLSERNLKYYLLEQEKRKSLVDPERHTKRIMQTMMTDLRMNVEPRKIECFDNSNIQGTDAVSAMVCFIDGKPAKKEYRHYNIKTVEGPNDFASMEEVVYRRYKRVLDEGLDMPQLIVIDGGKGQVSSALKSLEKLDLRNKVTVIGIAERLEGIFFPGDEIPLYLNKNSETLKVIQQIRDEAHRFGITHHRNKRSKSMLGKKSDK